MNETRLTAGKVLEDANGKPKALIEQLFGFKDDEVYSLHQEALSKEIEFNWGNSIWVKPGESLSSLFLETIETKLKADSSNTLDLKKINAWVEKVNFKMPKFKIEMQFLFKRMLRDLGYGDFFKIGDYSRMTILPGCDCGDC